MTRFLLLHRIHKSASYISNTKESSFLKCQSFPFHGFINNISKNSCFGLCFLLSPLAHTHADTCTRLHTHTCTCIRTQIHKRIEEKTKMPTSSPKNIVSSSFEGLLLKTILHINKTEAFMVRQSSQVILSNVTESNIQTTFYIHIFIYKVNMNTKHNLLQNNLNERYKPTINVFNQ